MPRTHGPVCTSALPPLATAPTLPAPPPAPSRAYWASVARYEQAALRRAELALARGRAVCPVAFAQACNALLTARAELESCDLEVAA